MRRVMWLESQPFLGQGGRPTKGGVHMSLQGRRGVQAGLAKPSYQTALNKHLGIKEQS